MADPLLSLPYSDPLNAIAADTESAPGDENNMEDLPPPVDDGGWDECPECGARSLTFCTCGYGRQVGEQEGWWN
jgi:hypothetical protein